MNITLLRFKGLVLELQRIRIQLERMNDLREAELAYNGLHLRPPQADTSGEAPEALYTDEETDYLREVEEQLGKRAKEE